MHNPKSGLWLVQRWQQMPHKAADVYIWPLLCINTCVIVRQGRHADKLGSMAVDRHLVIEGLPLRRWRVVAFCREVCGAAAVGEVY